MTVDPPALKRADWDRKATQPERAAETLGRLAAAAPDGGRLGTKDELRARCAVSVGTFNEALRLAQARGVVAIRPGPGGGIFAVRQSPMVRLGHAVLAIDHDPAVVADAVRLRDVLDPLLVRDALEHAQRRDIEAMRGLLDDMQAAMTAADTLAFLRANWALHARIAEVSPHPVTRSIYLGLLGVIESHTTAAQIQPHDPDAAKRRYDVHAALVEAIAAGDERALEIIEDHNMTRT